MKWSFVLCAALLTFLSAPVLTASAADDGPLAGEVKKDVERTLDLWRDGRYEEVYARVIVSGSHTREYFISHLAAAPRRPSCCWEKMQEVRVTVKDTQRATLTARFGFDSGAGVETMTRELKLFKDEGIWKIKIADVLSLAGKGKKVSGGKKKAN